MPAVRGHNEGSIFHRKADGHRVATVSMPNGKRPTLSCPHVHRPSDRDCPESKANLVELLRLRDHGAPAGGHTLTLGAYLTGWLADVRPQLAPATWRKHESIIRTRIVPNLGHVRLSELSVSDCRRLFAGDGRLAAQSLRHHRATLRRALSDGVRDGLITRNVAALAEPPRMSKKERTVLDAGQVRTLREGTKDDRLHALWVLAATTGMREAEMLGLTWDDIHLGDDDGRIHSDVGRRVGAGDRGGSAGGLAPLWRDPHDERSTGSRPDATGPKGHHIYPHIKVRSTLQRVDGEWKLLDPKTEKSKRDVALPPVTVAALREHRIRQLAEQAKAGKLGKSGLVFTTERGRPIHGSNLTKVLYAHLERLGLPKVTVHDLRHSAATVLYAAGIPLESIADMLGHSTTRVTADLYRHRVPEMQRDIADRMQEAVG
jgi:integrase